MSLPFAVLVSGSGTNLQALLDRFVGRDQAPGELVVVGSDRPDAHGLERARAAGIPTVAVAVADHPDRQAWEQALVDALRPYGAQAAVLAGFMRIVTRRFLDAFPAGVLNTHPSLLPAFRGAHAVRDALEHGVKVTGSTVHFVDEQVDHGPIVAQRAVEVQPGDSEEHLHERIKAVEHQLLPAAVELLCAGRLRVDGRTVTVLDQESSP